MKTNKTRSFSYIAVDINDREDFNKLCRENGWNYVNGFHKIMEMIKKEQKEEK